MTLPCPTCLPVVTMIYTYTRMPAAWRSPLLSSVAHALHAWGLMLRTVMHARADMQATQAGCTAATWQWMLSAQTAADAGLVCLSTACGEARHVAKGRYSTHVGRSSQHGSP